MFLYSFEKLEVWRDIRDFTKKIFLITKKFPSDERFSLVAQIKRATLSISSNLAEGTSRSSMKDQARFTEIAFGSLVEVLNHLIIAVDLDFISTDDYNDLRPDIEKIGNKLNALKNSQLRKVAN